MILCLENFYVLGDIERKGTKSGIFLPVREEPQGTSNSHESFGNRPHVTKNACPQGKMPGLP
jgi:hypothetical protein